MRLAAAILTALLVLLPAVPSALAEDFDSVLHPKAEAYTDWLIEWHSTGLGGVSDVVFTDENRTALYRLWGSGDSTDWTATYLVSQCLRYRVTGEAEARDEVLRIARYLHDVQAITEDPGYIARYAGPDEAPWNVESLGADNFYQGTGEYAGMFWLGHESRDKYMHWFWALTWAYLAVDDEEMRTTIRTDFVSVIEHLISNNWRIIDPWGNVYSAADIGPDLRLTFLLQVATVTGDQQWWDELDAEYERDKTLLWVTTIAFFNKYMEYYAFINSQAVWQPLFMLWPDRPRLEHLFDIWYANNRQWQENTHNPFFDAIYYEACLRLGNCDAGELTALEEESRQNLLEMNEAPNWQRQYTCTEMELDPFSVWADEMLTNYPWLEELFGIDIDPQTSEAHEVWDRCWASVLWERSPYHTSCGYEDDPTHVTHGMDYLIGYWLGVYYGILPGDGPYGDDDLTEPGDDDDDNDNDAADDDAADDDDDDDAADDDDDDALDPCCVHGDPCGLVDNGACDCPDMPWDYPECVESSPTPAPAEEATADEDDDEDGCG